MFIVSAYEGFFYYLLWNVWREEYYDNINMVGGTLS